MAGTRRQEGHLSSLHILRAIAALGVVFGHAGMLANAAHAAPPGPIGFLAANGWKGIYLFFAISGYLIARPFVLAAMGLRPPVDVADYARRRAARILPAHWLALTAMVGLLVLDGKAVPRDFTVGRYVAHMLLVQNFAPGVARSILPVTWTLGIEAIFYVTVPVTFRLATRAGRRRLSAARLLQSLGIVWLIAGAVMLVDNLITPATPAWFSVLIDNLLAPTLGYLFFFAPGIIIAVLEGQAALGGPSRLLRWAGRNASSLIVLALCAWVAAGEVDHAGGIPAAVLGLVLDALLGGAAVLAAITGLGRTAFPRAAVRVGEVSYGIYLWHWLVANALLWAGAALGLPVAVWANQTLDWLALSAATLPIAWLSWVAIEQPCMRWARDRQARSATLHAAPQVAV